jgi:hypothetical protein
MAVSPSVAQAVMAFVLVAIPSPEQIPEGKMLEKSAGEKSGDYGYPFRENTDKPSVIALHPRK